MSQTKLRAKFKFYDNREKMATEKQELTLNHIFIN